LRIELELKKTRKNKRRWKRCQHSLGYNSQNHGRWEAGRLREKGQEKNRSDIFVWIKWGRMGGGGRGGGVSGHTVYFITLVALRQREQYFT